MWCFLYLSWREILDNLFSKSAKKWLVAGTRFRQGFFPPIQIVSSRTLKERACRPDYSGFFFLCLESGLQHSLGSVVRNAHAPVLSVGGEVYAQPTILCPERYRTVGFSVSFSASWKMCHRRPGFCTERINLITSQITLCITTFRTLDLLHMLLSLLSCEAIQISGLKDDRELMSL